MAFKEVNDLSTDVTISLGGVNKKTGKPNPKSIEGYYLGNRQVEDKKKKSGVSYIYVFQTDKGNVGVWGKTDLDRKMQAAPLGAMLQVTHTGMAQTPNGEMYKYGVKYDPENTIDVSDMQSSNSSGGTDLGEGLDDDFGTDAGVDEDEVQIAALAAAERKAKVEALLKGKGKKTA